MEEKKFVQFKKEELGVKEFIKRSLGKGRISNVVIEYTPVGEKIVVYTNRPGYVAGARGSRVSELTKVLKTRFKFENPHIEIADIQCPELDAQLIADEIALSIERKGPLKFKMIAYRILQKIKDANALGAEIILSGKLPSERARTSRFTVGYLKKTGDCAKIVDKAESIAISKKGVTGVKVSILPPNVEIHDQITITPEIKEQIKRLPVEEVIKKTKRKAKKKVK